MQCVPAQRPTSVLWKHTRICSVSLAQCWTSVLHCQDTCSSLNGCRVWCTLFIPLCQCKKNCLHLFYIANVRACSYGEVGSWGRDPFSRNLMSPTPRRKWYLTTGRRFHSMVLDPIPQSLPVHFFGSRPSPPPLLLCIAHWYCDVSFIAMQPLHIAIILLNFYIVYSGHL